MVTSADDFTQLIAELRGEIAEAFHPDFYEIHRTVSTDDSYGGATTTPTVLEQNRRCRLSPSNRLGDERLSGNTVRAASSYVAQLPIDSVVRETDTLVINGNRRFEIVEPPKRGGNHSLFTELSLEERR